MGTRTRLIGLAAVGGACLIAGTLAAPAQAAPLRKPVTSGTVQLTLDAPLLTAFSATSPGRTTPTALVYPVTGVSGNTVSVGGQLTVTDPRPGGPSQTFPFTVAFDRAAGTGSVILDVTAAGTTQPLTYFVFNNVKASGPTTKVNLKKRVRSVTTTWTGDLRLSDNPPGLAEGLNAVLGTSYVALDKVGSISIRQTVTSRCKIASCKR